MRKHGKMKRIRLSNEVGKTLRGKSRGFTLIEVLIALALFAIIAIVFAGGLSTASKAVLTADVRTRAESLARTQMESIKNQPYSPAPTGGVGNYTKIDLPASYSICSFNRTSPPPNCGPLILGVPWNSGNNIAASTDTGLQKITLVIKHDDIEVTRLEGYKLDR
jgi:prepilin-type N-terminal cleavage/methylation domain-containing protein